MTETQQTRKIHHTLPPPTLGRTLLDAVKEPWARWLALALAGLVILGLTFNYLRTAAYWAGNQILVLPEQMVQGMQNQLYPQVSADNLVVSGIKYADYQELLHYLTELLMRQLSIDKTLTVMDVDLNGLEAGLQQHPWVSGARISRLHTGQIAVHVQEHEPRALYVNTQKQYWLINEAGEAFVRIKKEQAQEFANLLVLTGNDAELFLPELLAARRQVPQAFESMVSAERMRYSGWKLHYQRPSSLALYYVYIHGKNTLELTPPLERLVKLEQHYQLSARAVRGYDLRAWPKVRVDLLKKG